jgi:hypothetical protein
LLVLLLLLGMLDRLTSLLLGLWVLAVLLLTRT